MTLSPKVILQQSLHHAAQDGNGGKHHEHEHEHEQQNSTLMRRSPQRLSRTSPAAPSLLAESGDERGNVFTLNGNGEDDMRSSMDDDEDDSFAQQDYNPTTRIFTYEQVKLFDIIFHPIYVFDHIEGRMRWANKAGCALWNATSLEDLQSRSFRDTSESSAKRMDGYMEKFERGMNIQDQWTLYPNGKATTVNLDVSGIKFADDDDPHFCLWCEATPLVNEQLLLQESLRGVEMIRHLPMAICQFDMEGKVMFQNPEAIISKRSHNNHNKETEDLDRLDRSDHSTSSLLDSNRSMSTGSVQSDRASYINENLLHRFVDPGMGWQVLREIQSPMKQKVDIEAMVHTRNGAKWSAIQLRKGKDPVTGQEVILYSAKDKSDAVKARREREARERKSEFLAIMAHEIRTPLHQVTGFIDLLDQTSLNAEQKSFVRLLKSSAQGLMTVISDVLDYSKLEACKMKLECIPYEPLSVVEGSMAAVRASCEEKGLYLNLQWNKNIPYKVKGDPNRLRQILLNLLSNAIKFTKQGGITVKAMPIPSHVDIPKADPSSNDNEEKTTAAGTTKSMIRFEVRDTGVGISEEHKDVIFLKYQQANASVARNFGGTGLGLSICKLLAKNMGGEIGVESTLGHGALFWVNVPAEVAEEFAPSSDEEEEEDVESMMSRMTTTDRSEPNVENGGGSGGGGGDHQSNSNNTKGEQTANGAGRAGAVLDPSQGLHILVAEDNKVNRKLLGKMLERMGHTSEMAVNGKEAVDMVTTDDHPKYDVVLMDIQMPVMDGLEATRRLRTMGYSELPIYGLTASVARNDYKELGFDDWIGKPIPMKDLKSKLGRLKDTAASSGMD